MILEKKFILAICLLAITHMSVSQTLDGRCQGIGSHWIQDLLRCEGYYACVNGVATPGDCPDGRWFNPTTQTCNLPGSFVCTSENAPIPIEPEPPVPEPEPPLTECPARGVFKISHKYSCQQYTICVNGLEFDQMCPEGEHFSAINSACVGADQAECTIDEDMCDPAADVFPYFVTSTRDCRSYYLCMSRTWLPLRCAPGFFFDDIKNWCQIPEKVDCIPSIDHDLELPEGILEYECDDVRGATYHIHPESCNHYFICMNGNSNLRFCPRGLEYDESRQSCNHPQLANCDRSGALQSWKKIFH